MADQLRWEKIDTNFGTGGGSGVGNLAAILQGSMNPFIESMKEEQLKAEQSRSMQEAQKGLSITDPDLFNQAMRDGIFKIDKYNIDLFKTRASDLLTDRLNKLTTDASLKESAAALETRKITDAGAKLTNTNTSLLIDQNRQILKENLDNWNQKLEVRAVQPEAMKQMAQLQDMATGGVDENGKVIPPNPAGALKIARSAGFVEMAIKGGFSAEQLRELNSSFYASAESSRAEELKQHESDVEKGRRGPLEARQNIEDKEALKDAQSGVATSDAARATAALKAADQQDLVKGGEIVRERMNKILTTYGSYYEMEQAVDQMTDITELQRGMLKSSLRDASEHIATMTPEQYIEWKYQQDPTASRGQRTETSPAVPASGFVGLLDKVENGGGGYSALFNQGQSSSTSPVAGKDVRTMTLRQIDAMSGQYGDWVAGQNGGVTATPMGRYQIVNSTLQEAARNLGMDPNTTVFDEATQDKVFRYLLERRLGGAGTAAEKLDAVRKEWVGLKNVDDATLMRAINDYRAGEFIKPGVAGGGGGPGGTGAGGQGREIFNENIEKAIQGAGQAFPIDETHGERATKFLNEITTQKTPMDPQQWSILHGVVTESDSQMASVRDKLVRGDMFGGNTAGLISAIQKPGQADKLSEDVVKSLKETFTDIDVGNLTTGLKTLENEYGLKPGVIEAFMKAAPYESYWILSNAAGIQDNRQINLDEVRSKLNQFIAPGADKENAMNGFLSALEQQRAKTNASAELAKAQTAVREAYDDLAKTASRMRGNPGITDNFARARVTAALAREQAVMDMIHRSDLVDTSQDEQDLTEVASGKGR